MKFDFEVLTNLLVKCDELKFLLFIALSDNAEPSLLDTHTPSTIYGGVLWSDSHLFKNGPCIFSSQ